MRPTTVSICLCSILAAVSTAAGQTSTPPDTTVKIEAVKVSAARNDVAPVSTIQKLTLPATAGVTAARINQTVNVLDVEDAVKYLPSVFLRKRNYGDTQATMATRVWGVSSSARSLIFADGVPLTALIANNNTIGGPRWGLVSPAEVKRIDMMYGPFSAAYAGNSMGAVMEITTRLPDRLEGSIEQTEAVQAFSLYGTDRSYGTAQTAATVGDRFGKFAFWASGNYQNSNSQPLQYATSGTFPNGTTGGYAAQNKLGATANVLGATGLLHTGMSNGRVKLAYDLTPTIRAAYTAGYWWNDADAGVDTYLTSNATSQPTLASQSAFASGFYHLEEQHSSHSLSVRSDRQKDWDFELVGTRYNFGTDKQQLPSASSSTDTVSTAGRIARLDGTGWTTFDAKMAWHAGGLGATHIVSFGAHADQYHLSNPTYNTPDWRAGDSVTTVATEGDGKTRTYALWAQDAWWITPSLRLTAGVRYEDWRGYDGFNANGSTTVAQPPVSASRFSPKGTLSWDLAQNWNVTASLAKAYRFATAAELYQLVSTGATFTSPDPHLKPDNDLASELRVRRDFTRGSVQLSLFRDDVHDAIISQFLPLVPNSTTLYSYLSNVDHVRAQGLEVSFGFDDVMVRGLDVSGSATWLDAKTLALSGRANASAPAGTAVGKFLPNIPDRRASFVTTYRPVQRLAFTVAGRYNGRMFTTLDNADVNPNTYQGFTEWFVLDAHASYALRTHWSATAGVDNLLDRKYFLFHPFPQRTMIANLKYAF